MQYGRDNGLFSMQVAEQRKERDVLQIRREEVDEVEEGVLL